MPTFHALHKDGAPPEDNAMFDLYQRRISSTLDAGHVIFLYITHRDPLRLHCSSRIFLSIHHHIFIDCEASTEEEEEEFITSGVSHSQLPVVCVY
jgi:hypothetical protein